MCTDLNGGSHVGVGLVLGEVIQEPGSQDAVGYEGFGDLGKRLALAFVIVPGLRCEPNASIGVPRHPGQGRPGLGAGDPPILISVQAQGYAGSRSTMGIGANHFLGAVAVGIGASLAMDLWNLLLKRAFGIPFLTARVRPRHGCLMSRRRECAF